MKLYSKYGSVFKVLRKQRGFNLTSFIDLGISPSTLCKFENGQSMIKFDRLILVLSRMTITLSEYEKFLNNYGIDVHEQLVEDTLIILTTKKYEKLPELHNEALDLDEKSYATAIKGQYQNITSIEVDEVCDYFETIKFWRHIDLYALYLMIDYLKPQQISYFLEGFFTESNFKEISNSLEHNIRLAQIVCRSIVNISHKGYEKLSKHFLEYINPKTFVHTMYTKNLYEFAKGCWQAEFEDRKKGEERMELALNNFRTLGSPNVADYYKNIYIRYKLGEVGGFQVGKKSVKNAILEI